MSDIVKNISYICKQIVVKPTNFNTNNYEEYITAFLKAKQDPHINQEITINKGSFIFYVNVRKDISIKLYNILNTELSFDKDNIDPEVLKVLNEEKQIIKNLSGEYHVAMQKGDVQINFNDSAISQKISENKFEQKNGVIIKGQECFLRKVTPGGRSGDHYHLLASTKEELKIILIELTNI